MKIITIIITTLVIVNLCHALVLKSSGGDVKFTAIGNPGILKIKGESKDEFPRGEVKIESGKVTAEFSFNLRSLKTGIGLRDGHMTEKYLEVSKPGFDKATLKVLKLEVSESELNSGFKKAFEGELTLHGVSKAVKGDIEYDSRSKKANSKFTIILSDFGIDIPSYMTVKVSEKVDLDITTILM